MELSILEGVRRIAPAAPLSIAVADEAGTLAYRALRRAVFVEEQQLFDSDDRDALDDDPRTVVLVARLGGEVVGGVRLAPALEQDLGWWTGSRLVVRRDARGAAGLGAALVRAACAEAESRGVIRFEATVQRQNEILFRRLGWDRLGTADVAGLPHVRMRWPIDRFDRLARAAKASLGPLLEAFAGQLGGPGFRGDDGAPVPGSDLVAVCDAIVPSMVERDPEWAGWCSVLVNVNDLTAMGADPVGLLDAVGARDTDSAARILRGLRDAAEAWGVPLLGGHTQLGVPAALSVTGLGRTARPVPGSAPLGHELSLTVDVSGSWRPGYAGAQWDSTSWRSPDVLRSLAASVGACAPDGAKDVSMAGLVGTVGMLAEASGGGAEIDVTAVPRPAAAGVADWLSCFPGFAMLTADPPGRGRMRSPHAVTAPIGRLVPGEGVVLRWPDGETTRAIASAVTRLGAA
ncbi:MSMEG_0567/sll0787 family protein [Rathayibacter sp. SD072]|uniref:MSMEG_0567/sll0787 family protein n=1 Tax=Rathayibacter sp. SD072 TaxID=2781731 RepID=UPI001A9689F7|nr:MSMEG_0567/sll0787 family protein [Rathayibacter sp. SD072]MBO0983887.1 GNAT family N-acetyltransferase [Rathayibacter sp. SD072]